MAHKKDKKELSPAQILNRKLKQLIKTQKGKRFSYSYVCDLCGHNHTTGYLFKVEEGNEYEICKYCCKKHDYMIFINTPMGD